MGKSFTPEMTVTESGNTQVIVLLPTVTRSQTPEMGVGTSGTFQFITLRS